MTGLPVEFVLFAAVLVGVAVLHKRPLAVTLTGLAAIVAYKLVFTRFDLPAHFAHEWVVLANLLLLLVGFALLSSHFERSNIPEAMPAILPDNWTGGLVLLGIVFALPAVLDNIAAAVIGGVMARHVYRGEVGVGFLAAIVAAANAGGAGSVLGDTTPTMMGLHGLSPILLLDAFVASVAAFAIFAPIAAWRQDKVAKVVRDRNADLKIDWVRALIVLFMLGCIVAANVLANSRFPHAEEHAPVLGLALWGAILVSALVRRPGWEDVPEAAKGAVFLVALVACASLMPVDQLPTPSWHTTFGLGVVSALFDNIPLTALALKQGGYDWPLLAYAMGVGGSMLWFGSSAGVALTSEYPQGRSVVTWVKEGWYVAVAYVVGFFVMLALFGWHPG